MKAAHQEALITLRTEIVQRNTEAIKLTESKDAHDQARDTLKEEISSLQLKVQQADGTKAMNDREIQRLTIELEKLKGDLKAMEAQNRALQEQSMEEKFQLKSDAK